MRNEPLLGSITIESPRIASRSLASSARSARCRQRPLTSVLRSITIQLDGMRMAKARLWDGNEHEPPNPIKASETEKITINLGPVDLGQIDLLVQEGFYSNRTDLIRTAIRNQLASHVDVIKQTVARKQLVLGLQHFSRADLEAVRSSGQKLQIQVLGLASIGADVTPKLALDTIDSVVVLGAFHASPAVKAALAGRIR